MNWILSGGFAINWILSAGFAILILVNGLQLVHSMLGTGRYTGFPNPSAVLNLIGAGFIGYGISQNTQVVVTLQRT